MGLGLFDAFKQENESAGALFERVNASVIEGKPMSTESWHKLVIDILTSFLRHERMCNKRFTAMLWLLGLILAVQAGSGILPFLPFLA